MTNPFVFLDAINSTKRDLIAEGEQSEKDYKPYFINRSLSYHPDSIFDANEMNTKPHLPGVMQFGYLINSLPKAKRFAKWIKPEQDADVEAVMEYFGYNRRAAKQIMKILSKDDIMMIKEQTNKGGVDEQRDSRKLGRSKAKKPG